MWEVLLSRRLIFENVLRELNMRFHFLSVQWRFSSQGVDACTQLLADTLSIPGALALSPSGTQGLYCAESPAGLVGLSLPSLFQLLASSHVTPKTFAGVYKIRKLLLPPRLFSMLLHGLVTLSESPDSARKILVMLPDLTNILHSVHSDDKMRALLIFRNVMGHLKKQASSIALELAGQLRHLFDDERSQIRELSICLFKDIIQMADWKDKRQMQKKVRRSLVPLVLHMSDEMESVAKASQEALWAAAKVLKCKGLSPHVETLERWRTVELLLEQEQSRAEEYVCQSLLYLQHAQVSVRLAAVRFIGKPQPLESLFWQPGPSPICCTGNEEQPCGCQSIDCPVQGLCSQGICASPSNPCPRSGAQWHLAQCHLPLGPVLPWDHPAEGKKGCSQTGRGGAVLPGACWAAVGLMELSAQGWLRGA
ncbi:uncharacterized protein LOC133212585 [Neopsephotus bourkii]|uniref:uncharacterized protein LOC133212585 n=1 Tax=Neopsephotus bourkii TaxID=309878 RepID=UPI002AA5C11C|nr:uncharacterized protein LOC133212585 [Neopsephotus bourkii]